MYVLNIFFSGAHSESKRREKMKTNVPDATDVCILLVIIYVLLRTYS